MKDKLLIYNILYIIIFANISCSQSPYPDGKRSYERYCENCHMNDGTGLPPMYPDLPSSSYLDANLTSLPCLIRNGRTSQYIENVVMPGSPMNEIEMTNLINYINHKWGDRKIISMQTVKDQLATCD